MISVGGDRLNSGVSSAGREGKSWITWYSWSERKHCKMHPHINNKVTLIHLLQGADCCVVCFQGTPGVPGVRGEKVRTPISFANSRSPASFVFMWHHSCHAFFCLQGRRGDYGPKGSQGPPGTKGEKVCLYVHTDTNRKCQVQVPLFVAKGGLVYSR